nr:hypothetical protein [Mycobacterium sp. 96-892]
MDDDSPSCRRAWKNGQVRAQMVPAGNKIEGPQARSGVARAACRCRNTQNSSLNPGADLSKLPPPQDIYALMEQRDAIDRVAQIDEDDTATRLIEAAMSADDETMICALLQAAYRYRWRHTIDAYVKEHPEQATAVTASWNETDKEQT